MEQIVLDRYLNTPLRFAGELLFSNQREPTSKKPFHWHALYETEEGLYVAQVTFCSNDYKKERIVMPPVASHADVFESMIGVLIYWRQFDHAQYFVVPPGSRKKDAHIIFENQYKMSLNEAVKSLEIEDSVLNLAKRFMNAKARPNQIYRVMRAFFLADQQAQATIHQLMEEDDNDMDLSDAATKRRLDDYELEALAEERDRRTDRIHHMAELLYPPNAGDDDNYFS